MSRVAGFQVQVPNEIKLGHYTNKQRLLLVGEGNFSFALSLATKFGSATNIVATTLDNESDFRKRYGERGWGNVLEISRHGGLVLFKFDACSSMHMEQSLCGINMVCFDRIIYNFPHVGFCSWQSTSFLRETSPNVIWEHSQLVRRFLANARRMLLPGGEIHVTHKLGCPYDEWRLEKQAEFSELRLKCLVQFYARTYPGYRQCRGGQFTAKASNPFNISNSGTYIFVIRNDDAQLTSTASATEDESGPKRRKLSATEDERSPKWRKLGTVNHLDIEGNSAHYNQHVVRTATCMWKPNPF